MADFIDGNKAFNAFKDILTTNVMNGKMLEGQTNEKPKFWIEVTCGGAGYFAVKLWDGEGYPEPWESGEGRYRTSAEAAKEAERWAAEEQLEFIR